ncbi:hypothetical protein PS938_03929 [Pseudomonas fluorescens]|uniref:Uncharacterized protein n=1 Tax=Pseudomonas fluorescens TaxID=294 RepID=A0A5E7UR57_PSEFL|nr:hypothetical protein [Pseudomonas fluorescens]VVQ13503.1 hypothetical protein PS938_03929 [Pseudomonas fluorescens]
MKQETLGGFRMENNKKVSTRLNWNADDIAFSVFEPGSLSYENLIKERVTRAFQHQPSTLIYDALALSYNQIKKGELMLLELPNRPTISNLRKTLEARGLDESDYRLFRSNCDERGQRTPKDSRPLLLHRLSEKTMRTVQPYLTIAAKMAEEAKQRGISHNFMKV